MGVRLQPDRPDTPAPLAGATNLARTLAVLECPAPVGTLEVVPLLHMARAHSAHVAPLVGQRCVAERTDERWRRLGRSSRVAALVHAAQDRPARAAVQGGRRF